jgi:SAM-dependent methyltransferase
VLWTGSWAFSTVLYALRLLPYRNLSWLTAGLICGAVTAFAGGASLGARIRPRRAPRPPGGQAQAVELAAWLMLALLGLTFVVFVSGLVSRFGLGQVLQISRSVKLYLSGGEAPLSGTYVEIAIAATTMCALAAATVTDPARRRRWFAATIACSSTVYFSTSRAFIIVALIAALAAYLLVGAAVNRRLLAAGAVVAVAVALGLFTGLGAVLGKTYGNSTIGAFDNFFSRNQIARPLALPYQDATASIPALDLLTTTSSTWGIAHGCATAPIACGVLRKVGVGALRVPVAGPFTRIPLQWNGYTFLERFLIDFGTGLTLVLVAITGALAAYLWRRAREGSVANVIVYAISVPVLVAAYRQNLIEIGLVASVIAVSVFVLCSAVLATAGASQARSRWLRRVNSLLLRLAPAPSAQVALAGVMTGGAAGATAARPRAQWPGLGAVSSALKRLVAAPRERIAAAGRTRGAAAPAAGARAPAKPRPARRVRPAPRLRTADPSRRIAAAGRTRGDAAPAPAAPAPAKPRPARRVGPDRRTQTAEPPERVDVAGRIPKTKEECEHYARYKWASRLVRGTVLDIACGTGYGTRMLARSVRAVSGVDRDQRSIEQARSRVRASFAVAEVPPIPIRAYAFNYVVCFETIEHIDDDVEFVRELSRVLRPKGKLLLSTPNAELSEASDVPNNPWHVREYTWDSLSALLENAGLQIVSRYMQSFPPVLPRGHRLAWRVHGLTWLLPRGVRFATRALLGDADVRRFKPRSRAPAYWVVIAEKRR